MRSVILTGISRGLGADLFAQLSGDGDRILGIGRRFTDEQVSLATAEPSRVRLHQAELADPTTLPGTDTLGEFLAGGSGPAVLIHNAGVVEPIGPIGQLPGAATVAAVGVNLTAPLLLTNAFMSALPPGRPARVLFISSGAAHRTIENWSVYSATKRGAEMFFDSLRAEHPDVYVANVNPGVMDTGMQAALRASDFPDRDRYVGLHDRGELPDPAEVARRIIEQHLDPAITSQ